MITFMQIVMVPGHHDELVARFIVIRDGKLYKVPGEEFVKLQVGKEVGEEMLSKWKVVDDFWRGPDQRSPLY